jgi:hypothetical protein
MICIFAATEKLTKIRFRVSLAAYSNGSPYVFGKWLRLFSLPQAIRILIFGGLPMGQNWRILELGFNSISCQSLLAPHSPGVGVECKS